MTIPDYAVLLILATVLFLSLAIASIATAALQTADLPVGKKSRASLALAIYGLAWITLTLGLAYSNLLIPRADQTVPILGLLVLGGTLLGLALTLGTATARTITREIPPHWLAAVQIYRVIGIVFLLMEADGLLSAYFALSTGWGDIAVGVAAPFVGYLLWRDSARFAWLGILWALAGLADLILVLYKAINSAPGPLQTTAFELPTVIVGVFPFPLIPLLVVPVSLVLHVLLIQKLISTKVRGDGALGR